MFFAIRVFYSKIIHSSFIVHTPNPAKVMPTITHRACDLRSLKQYHFVLHVRRVRSEAEALLCAVESFRNVKLPGRGDTARTRPQTGSRPSHCIPLARTQRMTAPNCRNNGEMGLCCVPRKKWKWVLLMDCWSLNLHLIQGCDLSVGNTTRSHRVMASCSNSRNSPECAVLPTGSICDSQCTVT